MGVLLKSRNFLALFSFIPRKFMELESSAGILSLGLSLVVSLQVWSLTKSKLSQQEMGFVL